MQDISKITVNYLSLHYKHYIAFAFIYNVIRLLLYIHKKNKISYNNSNNINQQKPQTKTTTKGSK